MKEFAKDILAMEQKLAAKEIQPEPELVTTAKPMEAEEEVKVGGLFSAKASAPGKPQAASSKP
jgi:hypothetical protein